MRVNGTTTSLIFQGFSRPLRIIEQSIYRELVLEAMFSIFSAVVRDQGDAEIKQLTLVWDTGPVFLGVNNQMRELTWVILGDAMRGIWQWSIEYGLACEIVIIDDTLGPVGTARVGLGYASNQTATS